MCVSVWVQKERGKEGERERERERERMETVLPSLLDARPAFSCPPPCLAASPKTAAEPGSPNGFVIKIFYIDSQS